MWIKDLPQETIEELCNALEKAPTMDWKMLMRKPFRAIYSPDPDDFINLIGRKGGSPAKVLLDDLDLREITIQHLQDALREIGNKKAISIIERGAKKAKTFDIHDLRGQPCSPSITRRQPEEHVIARSSCTPPLQRREQSETLRFPTQESDINAGRPCDPGLQARYMEMDSGLFPCLSIFLTAFCRNIRNNR